MPWPRGVPRKGHVNKDGSPHAKHGQKVVAAAPVITLRKVSVDASPAENPNHPSIHGNRPNGPAITEPCPNCGYAYADGGYCEDCGWSKPVNRLPWGTATGPSKRK